MAWNEEKITKEEHDTQLRDLRWEHQDELRDVRLMREADMRRAEQVLEDTKRAAAFEKKETELTHLSEVKTLTHKLNHVADERVKAAEERAVKAETALAVCEAKLELAGKTEEVGAEVLSAKEMIADIRSITEKVIDRLPVLDINNISVNIPQGGNQQKGNDNKGNNNQEKKA